MGIEDYKLHGGIDSKVEKILSIGLNATPESIQGLIAELKNMKYTSDLEYLLGCLMIEFLEQRLNSNGMSEGIMGYQEDLRNAISVIQSRLDDLDAEDQSAFNEIQSALNTLQTTVNSLSTTVQGKANSTDLADALALKADKTEIEPPKWGSVTGHLADQTDLVNALAAKASLSNLSGVDTRTRALEAAIVTKADQSALDAKANTTDVNAAFDLKADTSYVVTMLNTKASNDAVNAKANTADVEERFAQMTTVVNAKANTTDVNAALDLKASATLWSDVEIPVSGWSSSKPYTQTVTVSGALATYHPDADIKFTDITDSTAMADEKSYYNCVDHIAMGDNSITLICLDTKPAGTFHIKMKEVS